MDTTREYIEMLMSSGAEQVQELWQPTSGDLFFTSCTSLSNMYGGKYRRDMVEELKVKNLPMPDLNSGEVYMLGQETDSRYRKWSIDCFPEPDERELLKHFIWIPRQDQSQEMIDFDLHELSGLPMKMSEVMEEIGMSRFYYCRTMERLWFALVMEEKFEKMWLFDSRKWVTTDGYNLGVLSNSEVLTD